MTNEDYWKKKMDEAIRQFPGLQRNEDGDFIPTRKHTWGRTNLTEIIWDDPLGTLPAIITEMQNELAFITYEIETGRSE